jgi:cytidylate kinase
MSQPSAYLYKNITISGLPGCGSTTLLNLLKEKLGAEGWTGFSGGEHMRAYAIEKGYFKVDENGEMHHDATVYPDDFDRQVDFGMRNRLETGEHSILESWLSGFMAQQVPGTLKILMTCSDEAVRIDRVVNRDGVTIEDAKRNMRERYDKNYNKWSEMYAEQWKEWVAKPGTLPTDAAIDFWHPNLYDLILDTYKLSKGQTLQAVLDAITAKS